MEKAFNAGAEAILAHSDSPIPRANDSHAFQRLPARRWPAFHSSIVAIVNRPSTIRGQRVAVGAAFCSSGSCCEGVASPFMTVLFVTNDVLIADDIVVTGESDSRRLRLSCTARCLYEPERQGSTTAGEAISAFGTCRCRWGSCGEGAQIVEGLGKMHVQALCGVIGPGLDCLAVGSPAGLSCQSGQSVGDVALPQRLGYDIGKRCVLGQLAFA
jgi:hypothetical protein